MKKILLAAVTTLSALIALFAYPTSRGSGTVVTPGGQLNGPVVTGAGKTYTGQPVDTRWGIVQVEITVSGKDVTSSQAIQYPQGNNMDYEINAYALPILNQEAATADSATIDAVSGATVTSDGYITSLQSALDQVAP